ncbi:MAG: hypothetical protein ACRCW3_02145, partial [Metamycoplasmataceae bacterium]
MISNLKKLALGIMSTGGILVPLAVVASCGTTEEDVDLKITEKTNPEVSENDLDGDNYKSLATLQKVFTGITASDLANVTVTKETVNVDEYVIVLTAKEGYTIGGQKTLRSATFKLSINMEITPKTDPTLLQQDIEGEEYKTLTTLEKVFDGVTASNLGNLTVSIEGPMVDSYTITLTANEGYLINGQKTLTSASFILSAVNMDITARSLTPNEIKASDVDNEAFKSYATLQKLFEFDTAVVTEELLDEAVVVTMAPMSGNQPRIVTLETKPGYAINGVGTLDSNQFIIPINYVINKAATVPTDIKPSDIENDNYKTWAVVSKLFTGADFTQSMLGNLDIELLPITEGQTYQIKLTPKNNFHINGGTTGITSDTFTLSVTNF